MNDFDDPLPGYRPSGPPADLRARIMREAERATSSSLRDWLPAIATAGLIALFAALSHKIHVDIEARLSAPDDVRPVEQWLPDDVGGLR